MDNEEGHRTRIAHTLCTSPKATDLTSAGPCVMLTASNPASSEGEKMQSLSLINTRK